MVVIYYTQPYFLDAALETINLIKNQSKLYVLIELTPNSKVSNILNIKDINTLNTIDSFYNVIDKDYANKFKSYFKGVAGVYFIVYPNRSAISIKTYFINFKLFKFINKLKADFIHFDTYTLRSTFLLPFLSKYKIFSTIHDVNPHSGENSWKVNFINYIFSRCSNAFYFYSKYSYSEFIKKYPTNFKLKSILRLLPYNFNNQFNIKPSKPEYILFFGRLSYYKGIDIFLNAIPIVLQFYPNQLFCIAGKSENYIFNSSIYDKYKSNILFMDKYHSPLETVNLFKKSKFIVCPYRDATQSGVLMTAFALNKITIATKTGAFTEYIKDNFNGILTDTTSLSIAMAIVNLLNNNNYSILERNNYNKIAFDDAKYNMQTLLNTYTSLL